MKAIMLIICLFFSQSSYGHVVDGFTDHSPIVPLVVPVEQIQLEKREAVRVDNRVKRLEEIAKSLEERVTSLELKVDELRRVRDKTPSK